MNEAEVIKAIAKPLLAWYDTNKRNLPWRGTKDPYKVWVSEIMLQQTRVEAVKPYYARWMDALPTVEALAGADEETLLKLWQGLGYYSRVRNLQRAARQIVSLGCFPSERDELLKLPGVGEYTAGAVASIAFSRPVPAVDGNVLRVAARTAAVAENVLDEQVRKKFRAWMEEAIPPERPGEFNQALMDLGAMVCLPGEPGCGSCPLAGICLAKARGLQNELPVRAKRPPRRVEEMTVYVLLRDGAAALRKRPESGLLAGLWEFPHVPGRLDENVAPGPLKNWGLRTVEWRETLQAKHLFTHVEWRMTGYVVSVAGDCPEFTWAGRKALASLAVPSAFGSFLERALAMTK